MHEHLHPRPDQGPVSLVLVDGEVNTLLKQDRQSELDSLQAHQPLKVPVRAAGEPEELAVRAAMVLEDGAPHCREEARLAVFQAVAEGAPRLGRSDPRAEE
jgi:hypothetical protein